MSNWINCHSLSLEFGTVIYVLLSADSLICRVKGEIAHSFVCSVFQCKVQNRVSLGQSVPLLRSMGMGGTGAVEIDCLPNI